MEEFFKLKNLKVRNEMTEDTVRLSACCGWCSGPNIRQTATIAKALKEQDIVSSDDEVVGGADRGSADEDSESADEDFQDDSDSDVAEEYDSNAESSGGEDGDVDMEDADGSAGGNEEQERPKKKAKTSK